MVLISLGFAVLAGGKLPYFVFYAVLLSTAIPFLWTVLTIKSLELFQSTDKEHVYAGDTVEINTTLKNRTLLPVPFAEVRNGMIKELTGNSPRNNIISIMPLDSKSVIERINCRYRGYYNLGPVNVNIFDVLGIFSCEKKVKCTGMLTVYPRVAKLNDFKIKPVQAFGTLTTKQKANEDYSSISDIRKYYPGDSYKKIHWKLSARKGMLHVKNYEMGGSAECYVFLDMFSGGYNNIYREDMEEKAVECGAAVVYYMLSKNINTGLHINCNKTVYTWGRDLHEFRKFMDGFTRVKSDGMMHMVELLESRHRLLPRGSSIIIITPMLGDNLVDKMAQLRKTGYDVVIIYIMLEDMNEENEKLLSQYGIRLYKVGLGDDVKTSLEG